jgi:hypothetical protein
LRPRAHFPPGRGLAPQENGGSLSNGCLMRASTLAVWACQEPVPRIAAAARADASLTHPNRIAQVRRLQGRCRVGVQHRRRLGRRSSLGCRTPLPHTAPPQDATAAYVLALAHLITHPGDAAGAAAAAELWARRGAAREVVEWLEDAAAPGPGPCVWPQPGYLRHGFVHAFRWARRRGGGGVWGHPSSANTRLPFPMPSA